MALVDTHCHLQSEKFTEDLPEVLKRTRDSLAWAAVVGDGIDGSRAALALAEQHDFLYALVGVHPYEAKNYDEAAEAQLREWATHPRVVAIGEMGLDYFNEFSPRETQRPAFERQLALACEVGHSVAIHNREADADTLAILKDFVGELPGCIMHCFGSDAAFAEECLALGFYISFAGNVTFPKAQALRDAAGVTPLERLLVETDAPYLAPQPRRGKRCEPAHVAHTAACLAELKGVSYEYFAEETRLNAEAVYRLPQG